VITLNYLCEHHVGISSQEDRGGTAEKVGEVEGREEGRLKGAPSNELTDLATVY
jgi:hypothetical protein